MNKRMRPYLVGMLSALVALTAACASQAPPQHGRVAPAESGRPYTDFQFVGDRGERHYLHRQMGDYTVLMFSRCVGNTHLPVADALQDMVRDHEGDEYVQVVGVDVHWSGDTAMTEHGGCHLVEAEAGLLSICDPTGGLRRLYGVDDSDWFFVIGPERTIVRAEPLSSSQGVREELRRLVSRLSADRHWESNDN